MVNKKDYKDSIKRRIEVVLEALKLTNITQSDMNHFKTSVDLLLVMLDVGYTDLSAIDESLSRVELRLKNSSLTKSGR